MLIDQIQVLEKFKKHPNIWFSIENFTHLFFPKCHHTAVARKIVKLFNNKYLVRKFNRINTFYMYEAKP